MTTADAFAFEALALTLLRPAMSPPDRLLGPESFARCGGGYLVAAGEIGLPVFVQPLAFAERSEDLGEPHLQRCREAISRFADSSLTAEIFLLVHNRDPRSPSFRAGLAQELSTLAAGGRVPQALVWDARDLIEAAFDGLFDLTAASARQGRLSVAPVEDGVAAARDLLAEVPLCVSWLSADQHRLGLGEPGDDVVADPAAFVLEGDALVRTFLLGGFGYGKTTAVTRALLSGGRHVLYVPGSSLTQEITSSSVLLSRCLNPEPIFGKCSYDDRQLYSRMFRAVAEHLFKDSSLPCALVIDGLDESPFLCRQAGLAHLLNILERVRIPVVLAMRSEYWLSRSSDLRSTAGSQASRGEPRKRQLRTLELLPWGEAEILSFVRRFRAACQDDIERQRLERLENLVEGGRFEALYGDIPRRPLFLRLIAESAAAEGLPDRRIGRARLFYNWARWKIRRDLRVPRPHLLFPGEPTEEVLETAWEAMLQAAGSMTQVHEGELELLPDCSFERIRNASPSLQRLVDVLALSLQSLLLLARERTGDRAARVSFAHRAFQEFFLAWLLAESYRDRDWPLPAPVADWIADLRQEGLLDPDARRDDERPPGLPPAPTGSRQWTPRETAARSPYPSTAEPADLVLRVLERPGGHRRLFHLRLTARDPDLDLRERPFGTITLETDPADFFRQHLKEVTDSESLRALGAFFAEQLLPADLRRLLTDLRHRVTTLQIATDDLWIPWEVLRLEEHPDNGAVDGPCLAEVFSLTRWLPHLRQTGYLPLTRIAAVVPRSTDLPSGEREWQDLESLAGGDRRVERIPARLAEVTEALRSGRYDGWHFTGHGRFRTSAPDLSAILLDQDEQLTPVHLAGPARRMGVTRPLVFLNACETGQAGLSLADAGGWAHHFLRAGAGAFLGCLWPITDSLSREFARVFYSKFVGGLPIAEAVQAARQAILTPGDPTWLAYAVYAHPRAVCRPVPGREHEARC